MVAQPRRQGTVPSHLSDYDLTGPGSQKRFHNPPLQNTQRDEQESQELEESSRATIPISQGCAPGQSVLADQLEDMRSDDEWQRINTEKAALKHQSSQMPELVAELKEIKQQHMELQQ